MIPRVPFASWVNVPTNSRTCFGPKRFLYRLHWPITGTDDAFRCQTPLKSIPLSFGPPQTATSNEYFLKLWTTSSSKCLPNSCLVIVEYHLRERHFGKAENTCTIAGWKKILDGRIFILCAVHVSWTFCKSQAHPMPSFYTDGADQIRERTLGTRYVGDLRAGRFSVAYV